MIPGHNLPFANDVSGLLRPTGDMSRFQHAMMLSILLHAIVLFGVTIRPPDLSKLNRSVSPLEVVLVNAKSVAQPLIADALAQHNLDGGGNTDLNRRAQSPLPVTRDDKHTTELTLESRRLEQLEQEAKKLLTRIQSRTTIDSAPTQPQVQTDSKLTLNAADIMNKSLEIARLEGQIAKDLDDYQKRPRRHTVGGRVKEYRFARYEEDWRHKVERIGTLNYPQVARDQKIYGSLLMTVSIKADGTLDSVEINRSSGQKILDDAARRIVQQAAPYAAFSSAITKDFDILSITRTWTFTRTDQLVTE